MTSMRAGQSPPGLVTYTFTEFLAKHGGASAATRAQEQAARDARVALAVHQGLRPADNDPGPWAEYEPIDTAAELDAALRRDGMTDDALRERLVAETFPPPPSVLEAARYINECLETLNIPADIRKAVIGNLADGARPTDAATPASGALLRAAHSFHVAAQQKHEQQKRNEGTTTMTSTATAADWNLIDLDAERERRQPSAALPAFPLDTLPPTIRRLAEEVGKAIDCPPEFVAGAALVVCATAIGGSRVGGITNSYHARANLFLALVAGVGAGKTPAMEYAVGPVHAAQDRQDGPAPLDLYTTSPTVEGLALALQGNQRGVLLHADEMTGWLRGLNQYKPGGKGSDLQAYLSMWSASPLKHDRKKEGASVFVPRPYVSIVGGLTPDSLPSLRSKGGEDGLLERFLFIYPEFQRGAFALRDFPDGLLADWAALIARLYALTPERDAPWTPTIIPFTAMARTAYTTGINTRIRPRFGEGTRKGFGSKFEVYLARLALILAVLRHVARPHAVDHQVVEEVDIHAALRLIEYFAGQAERIYQQLPDDLHDEEADSVLRWVRRKGGGFTVRELHRGGCLSGARWRITKAEQYAAIVQRLVDRGLVGANGEGFRVRG